MSATRNRVTGDALLILSTLRENAETGRSNKLAEVKTSLENRVALDFDSYFFFLRKFHYIAMDREAQLKLTAEGEGAALDQGRFSEEIAGFFADQLSEEADEPPPSLPEPTPPPALSADITLEPAMPQPRRKQQEDYPSVTAPDTRGNFGSPPPPPAPLPLTAAVSSPSQSFNPTRGQELDLRYQKGDQLGSGPLGTVYKGKHNALGLDVAIKELKDIFGYFSFLQRGEVIKRLKKELCAQAQVRHPAIAQIIDQNTDVARPYYVSELAAGSLRGKLDEAGTQGIAVPLAIRYFLQLAYGLRAAHQQGLTHHNLKPENVLFDVYGNAKLSDFGLSRVIEVDQSKGMPQVFVGTGGMGYMSPELIARAKEPGASSDVYALGILLYEMVTGQLPGRRSPLPSEINSQVPAKLDPIFDKMTQDRKESRYPDFDAVFDDFYAAFADKTYLARGDLLLWSELNPAS